MSAQLIGTPESVLTRIRALEAAGVTHLTLLVTFGDLAHDRVMASLRLFGREVVSVLSSEG